MINEKETIKERAQKDWQKIGGIKKELSDAVSKLQELQIDEAAALEKIDRALKLFPELRKLEMRLSLERAILKHCIKLKGAGVNSGLINFIVKKRLENIKNMPAHLKLEKINKLEEKIGVSVIKDRKEFFSRFRLMLMEAKNPDEIEVILRRVRLNMKGESELKEELQKEEKVREFVGDGKFDEKEAVAELLMSKNLSSAIREEIVTKKQLEEKFNLIEGDINRFSKDIIRTVDMKFDMLSSEIYAKPSFYARMISGYLIGPLRIVLSAGGILIIILYTVGRYIMGAGSLYSMGIETMPLITLCGIISPGIAYFAGICFLLLSGALKFLDDNLLSA
ncbi:MAG: hypothetical protein PF545_01090 [Elusimicrobia bacterium]|jgi:hypothetical protein|nr:hypothetical protein [Elusimicrobiota bacterium]